MLLTDGTPMVLYHATQRSRLAQIQRKGLKPRVPGKVWGVADPAMTRHHAKHPNKKLRDPDQILLTVMINWSAPKLRHYMSWFDPHKKKDWFFVCKNNPAAWFVYFGTIPPGLSVSGLARSKRRSA